MSTTETNRQPLQDLLIADPLHMRYLPGHGRRLVVSFSGVGIDRSRVPQPEFFRTASGGGANHVVFVADAARCWLNAPDMAEQITDTVLALRDRIGAEEIVAIGNSMGGTMALMLAPRIGFDRTVALAPQFSVHPDVVPDENRWPHARRKITEYRFRQVEDLPPEGSVTYLLHGDDDEELRHALKFQRSPLYDHYIFPQYGHRLARRLRRFRHLDRMMRWAIGGRRRRFRNYCRDIGVLTRREFEAARQGKDGAGQGDTPLAAPPG
ncbi:MAG: alpha/beta hydrolase [Pseudomonadota bacterium]